MEICGPLEVTDEPPVAMLRIPGLKRNESVVVVSAKRHYRLLSLCVVTTHATKLRSRANVVFNLARAAANK